jgi:cytochrome P450
LLLAGHETTALALSYTFYLLAQHPEAEARLVGELEQVLGDRAPEAGDVPRLRYAEWVIKEAMRLYPPAWGLGCRYRSGRVPLFRRRGYQTEMTAFRPGGSHRRWLGSRMDRP